MVHTKERKKAEFQERIQPNFLFQIKSFTGQQYVTVYTRYGKSLQGLVRDEMTASEINEMNNYFTSQYPNAIFLSDASLTYNCHSYAWNIKDGGTICWLNFVNSSNGDNVSKYWTNDYYGETPITTAPKIYYYNSDHSAVQSSVVGWYESKWGAAPLMRHLPGYGPYSDMGNRRYYDTAVYSSILNGNAEPAVNESTTYVASFYTNNVYYEWSVVDARGNERSFPMTINGNSCSITFTQSGVFEIYCYIYFNSTDENVGIAWQEALVGY